MTVPVSDVALDADLASNTTPAGTTNRRALRARRKPFSSMAILGLFVLCGLFGPYIVPHDPTRIDLSHSMLPPAWAHGGNSSFLLGTDQLGRDVVSRLLSGARVSLVVALTVVVLSGSFGVALAVIGGYLGGRVDSAITRITDAAMAFPLLLLAIVIVGTFGASLRNVVIILALAGWPQYCRVLRSEVLTLKTRDFVHMSLVMGGGWRWVIRRHLLPNIVSSMLVLATLQIGIAIIAEGSLSFLGIGVPPPAASWGGMLADGRQFLTSAWWLATLPGIALSGTVLAANIFGDWLRVFNDPAARR